MSARTGEPAVLLPLEESTKALPHRRPAEVARAYLSLTKPRIVTLLLVTTLPAMIVAKGGLPRPALVAGTLAAGALSAGGANAINCWYDRDIDRLMRRTSRRPMATGEIRPAAGFAFGVGLGVAAFLLFLVVANLLAALLSVAAFLFYVLVYTVGLKRRTAQNIVIGGAAGAFPPVIGWAAVDGSVSWGAVAMFAIIFLWTPPHFWALSLRLNDDYARASVPMLPVERGPAHTRDAILAYSLVLAIVAVGAGPIAGLSWIYLASAVAGSALFCWFAYTLRSNPAQESPITLYKYSLLYLALLFVAMAVDELVL